MTGEFLEMIPTTTSSSSLSTAPTLLSSLHYSRSCSHFQTHSHRHVECHCHCSRQQHFEMNTKET